MKPKLNGNSEQRRGFFKILLSFFVGAITLSSLPKKSDPAPSSPNFQNLNKGKPPINKLVKTHPEAILRS